MGDNDSSSSTDVTDKSDSKSDMIIWVFLFPLGDVAAEGVADAISDGANSLKIELSVKILQFIVYVI